MLQYPEKTEMTVIGYSMGGPAALAFVAAYRTPTPIPHTLIISKVHLIAIAAFVSHPDAYNGLVMANRVAHTMARWTPNMMRLLYFLVQGSLVHGNDYIDGMLALLSEQERRGINANNEWEDFVKLWRVTATENWRQGVPGFLGAVLATFGKSSPDGWEIFGKNPSNFGEDGSDLRRVRGLRWLNVTMWHGKQDNVAPITTAREIGELLIANGCDVVMNELDEENGHFVVVRNAIHEILKQTPEQ